MQRIVEPKPTVMSFGPKRGIGMSTSEKYRQHAADCVRLAHSVAAPVDRAVLMEMAAMWMRLAERAEVVGKDPASD
jgi:hypothetical protein